MPGFGSGIAGFAAGFPAGYMAGDEASFSLEEKKKNALALAAYGSMLQNLPGTSFGVPPDSAPGGAAYPSQGGQPAPFSQPQQPQQPSPYQGLSSNAYASADDYGTTLPQPQRPMANLSDPANLSSQPATFDQRFVFDPAAPVHAPQDLALARPAPRPASYTGQPMYDPWSRTAGQPMPQPPARVASAAPGGGISGGINQPQFQPGGARQQLPPPARPPFSASGGPAAPGPAGSMGPGASPFGFGGQGLTVQQVVQAARRANPNMPPDILGRVVQLAQPQMDSQQRMLAEAFRMQMELSREEEHKREFGITEKRLEEGAKRSEAAEQRRERAENFREGLDEQGNLLPEFKENAKAIADYEIPPPNVNTAGGRKQMAEVRKINPEYESENYAEKHGIVQSFKPQGQYGQRVSALRTIDGHLDTLDAIAKDLSSVGGIRTLSRWYQTLQTEFGTSATPNSFDTAKNVIAFELIRAVGSGPGGQEDRRRIERDFDAALDAKSLAKAINTARRLIDEQKDSARAEWDRGESYLPEKRRKDFYQHFDMRPPGEKAKKTEGAAGGQPVRVSTPEEARKLPKGTPIILPDGRTGTVP